MFIYPNWPAPNNVCALATTRLGGVSLSPYDSLNLGEHVGDKPEDVRKNRELLKQSAGLPNEPFWLQQTHSIHVLNLDTDTGLDLSSQAFDASYSSRPNQISVVMTADCLPVLFCSVKGNEVASAHAGWRGLCNGVLESTVKHFITSPEHILAWLGPAIGPHKFEVGGEVKAQFEKIDPLAHQAFKLTDPVNNKYLADIYLLARQRLIKMGITQIYGGDYCTVSDPIHFFSYRRESTTGRMASLIWFE